MSKFRKKPVVIEAVHTSYSNVPEIVETWVKQLGVDFESNFKYIDQGSDGASLHVKTLEGDMHVSPNDWIIRGVNGEFYPCKPDIFEKTYEPAD